MIKNSNSWHWLGWSLAASAILAVLGTFFFNRLVREKENGLYAKKQEYLERLKLIDEFDVKKIEDLERKDRAKANGLKLWLNNQETGRMPLGDDCGLEITNIVNAALEKSNLKLAKRELIKPKESFAEDEPILSFRTIEYKFKVSGSFKNMFMFLVRESFKMVSYHYRDIRITQSADGELFFTFILQVNYKDE